MKEITPKDSRYVPLVQEKFCCVPTSISIIMLRHGIPLIPQELLGYHLGLIVPKEFVKNFYKVRTGKKPVTGYGTQIMKSQFDPNKVFKRLRIPLKFTYHPITKFDDKSFVDFMVKAVKQDRDILTCFDHPTLKKTEGRGGHVCVLDRVYPKQGLVRIIDPSVNQPKWRVVKIKDLKKAMDAHIKGNSAGFWEFETVK